MDNSSHEAKRGGVPNRGGLYVIAASHSREAIEILCDLMRHSKNEGIRLGAAKTILNKALPDLKTDNGSAYLYPDEEYPTYYVEAIRSFSLEKNLITESQKS